MASGLGLFGILEQLVLLANAMAIINEERILKKCRLIRQLAYSKLCRRKRELYSKIKKAGHFRTLHYEELRQIFIDNCEYHTHFYQALIWINYYKLTLLLTKQNWYQFGHHYIKSVLFIKDILIFLKVGDIRHSLNNLHSKRSLF